MIKIDTEEKPDIDKYFNAANIPFTRERLEEGDYTNDAETFIVERKRGFDLFHSLKSKHIFVQLARMLEKHPNTPLYVIFEGDLEALIESISDTEYPGMRGLIRTFRYLIGRVYGATFIECFDMADTVQHIKMLDRYGASVKDYKVEFEPIYMSKCFDERIRNLLTVPQLGQERAQRLLNNYESISNIVDACINRPKEVLAIEGIGKKLLEKIILIYTGLKPFTKKLNMVNDEQRIAENQRRKQTYAIQNSKYKKGKE